MDRVSEQLEGKVSANKQLNLACQRHTYLFISFSLVAALLMLGDWLSLYGGYSHVVMGVSGLIYIGQLPLFLRQIRNLIKERERIEFELIDSKNFLSKVVNSIPDPIFVKDRKHRWILFNDAFCEFIGQRGGSLIGSSHDEFFSKEDADEIWKNDERIFKSGETHVDEGTIIRSNDEVRYIQTKKSVFA